MSALVNATVLSAINTLIDSHQDDGNSFMDTSESITDDIIKLEDAEHQLETIESFQALGRLSKFIQYGRVFTSTPHRTVMEHVQDHVPRHDASSLLEDLLEMKEEYMDLSDWMALFETKRNILTILKQQEAKRVKIEHRKFERELKKRRFVDIEGFDIEKMESDMNKRTQQGKVYRKLTEDEDDRLCALLDA